MEQNFRRLYRTPKEKIQSEIKLIEQGFLSLMQKKNIVIITTNFANGGTERRAMVLANGLADNGYTVTYLVLNKTYKSI